MVRNSLYLILTTVVNSAFGFVFWLVAARLFDAHAVGVTAAITSSGTIIVLLASLGVGGTLIHSLSTQSKTPQWSLTFWAGMTTAIVVSAVAAVIAALALPLLLGQLSVLQQWAYAGVFLAGTVASTSGAILDYVFIAERTAGNMFSRNVVVATLKVVLILVLTLALGTKALNLLGAWAAAAVAGSVVGMALLLRRVRVQRVASAAMVRTARELRSLTGGHQLIGMGAAMLPYLLPVIVTARLSASNNAYFYATWMMAGIFLVIAPALSQSLFAEGARDPEHLNRQVRTALATSAVILVPTMTVMLLTGGWLLSTFGSAYEHHAISLLRIVLLASIPDAINNIYVSVLRVKGRLAVAAGLNLLMGLAIVVLSWFLLPALGISAVGWSFLAVQTGGCVFVALDLHRQSTRGGAPSPATYASS